MLVPRPRARATQAHLFDPTSPRVLDGSVASLSDKTAGMLRELWWAVLEAQAIKFNGGGFREHIWAMFFSENIDTSEQVADLSPVINHYAWQDVLKLEPMMHFC